MKKKITNLLLDRWENKMIRRQLSHSQLVCALKKFDRKTAALRKQRVGQSKPGSLKLIKRTSWGRLVSLFIYMQAVSVQSLKKIYSSNSYVSFGRFVWTKLSRFPTPEHANFLRFYQSSSVWLKTPPLYWNYYLQYHWEITLWKIRCPFLISTVLNICEALGTSDHALLLQTFSSLKFFVFVIFFEYLFFLLLSW